MVSLSIKPYSTYWQLLALFFLFSACQNGAPAAADSKADKNTETAALYKQGEEVYKKTCQACHQPNGNGLPGAIPPLAKSDYLMADKNRAIRQVMQGSKGEITVNGLKYNSIMPPQDLSNEQVAHVLNYVLHAWGNNGEVISAGDVEKQRGS